MATAERSGRLLLAVPLACAILAGAMAFSSRSGSSDPPSPSKPLTVTARSVYDFRELDQLVASSDLVVRGRVAVTSRGRVVGEGDGAIVSRLVTVDVDEILAGATSPATVLVEEEGWLVDGTPIVVNGLAPSEDSMDAIWFLDALPDVELPGYLVINHQGRYVVHGDTLQGADGDDSLIERVERLGLAGLSAEVRRTARKAR